ncbi:hypothetical protein SEPCBS119000_002690 [Sporothrix epigloea]|uniref:Asl1-like glycosyl hydrolase catalytic domain-containing protein n=1 Tax=Sporothrix epigloea TaxID=1892477 RepID=A0ABP0DHH7_9PEZI
MYLHRWLPVQAASFILAVPSAASTAKRGLVFTPNSAWPEDNYIWTRPPSELSWYYNYDVTPSPVYNNISQTALEFVPMLWGAPERMSDTSFLASVKTLIAQGTNVRHVMAFNEPELSMEYGGSNVEPGVAAKVWVSNILPLQALGVKVGLPACSGSSDAVPWLKEMLANCSELVSTSTEVRSCAYDFVPLHWYGSFDGLAGHIGTYAAAFPDSPLWVTEFNYNNQSLVTTQEYFNTSIAYLERLAYVERYSYFGAFRSSVSNVGPNAAMLSAGGQLTDIGAWYLGERAAGIPPQSTSDSAGALSGSRPLLLCVLVFWLVGKVLVAETRN